MCKEINYSQQATIDLALKIRALLIEDNANRKEAEGHSDIDDAMQLAYHMAFGSGSYNWLLTHRAK